MTLKLTLKLRYKNGTQFELSNYKGSVKFTKQELLLYLMINQNN